MIMEIAFIDGFNDSNVAAFCHFVHLVAINYSYATAWGSFQMALL